MLNDTEQDHYAQFVQHQEEAVRLKPGSYKQLKQLLQVTEAEKEALIRATLIASVPLSPPAKEYLRKHHPDTQYPYDSVQFSGFTVTRYPEMYTAFQNTNTEIQQLIRYCFPDDKRHWRHMFYLENYAAFDALHIAKPQGIENRFWELYWLVNALGMNGHIHNNSAVFYNQSVHDRAMWLQQAMNTNTSTVADQYSTMILSELDIKSDADTALLLSRILTMTNRISNSDAGTLLDALHRMPEHKTIVSTHRMAFEGKELSVTYLPGMLGNLWALTHKETDLIAGMHLYSQLAQMPTKGSNPLSFRLVTKDVLVQLLEANFDPKAVKLNDSGEIVFNASYSKTIISHHSTVKSPSI